MEKKKRKWSIFNLLTSSYCFLQFLHFQMPLKLDWTVINDREKKEVHENLNQNAIPKKKGIKQYSKTVCNIP